MEERQRRPTLHALAPPPARQGRQKKIRTGTPTRQQVRQSSPPRRLRARALRPTPQTPPRHSGVVLVGWGEIGRNTPIRRAAPTHQAAPMQCPTIGPGCGVRHSGLRHHHHGPAVAGLPPHTRQRRAGGSVDASGTRCGARRPPTRRQAGSRKRSESRRAEGGALRTAGGWGLFGLVAAKRARRQRTAGPKQPRPADCAGGGRRNAPCPERTPLWCAAARALTRRPIKTRPVIVASHAVCCPTLAGWGAVGPNRGRPRSGRPWTRCGAHGGPRGPSCKRKKRNQNRPVGPIPRPRTRSRVAAVLVCRRHASQTGPEFSTPPAPANQIVPLQHCPPCAAGIRRESEASEAFL